MKKLVSVVTVIATLCVILSVSSSAETLEAAESAGIFETISTFFERLIGNLFGIDSPFRIVREWLTVLFG